MTVSKVRGVANHLRLALSIWAIAFTAHAAAEVELGAIKDNRAAGKAGRLTVEVKVSGEMASASAASRLRIDKAVDDSGNNLFLDQGPKYTTVLGFNGKTPDQKFIILTAQLASPGRSATTLKQFSGAVEMVVPIKNPASVVTFNPIKEDGQAIKSEALDRIGATVRVYLQKSYAAMRQLEKKSERPKATPTPGEKAFLDRIDEKSRRFFTDPPGTSTEISHRSVALEITDPQHKVANISMHGQAGTALKPVSTSYGYKGPRELRIYELPEAPTAKTVVKIFTETEETLVSEPFSYSNIALP